MAQIGKKFNVPVRVMEKGTQTPIKADFFYHTIEHIIPKE
jgi:hypothetical protein